MSLVSSGTEKKVTTRRHCAHRGGYNDKASLGEAGRNCPPIAAGNGRRGGPRGKQLRRQLKTELPRDQRFYAQVHPREE